ncbi:hypothetical protein CC78DRAFT_584974 [Lojkania enalia]|uniref:Uncharacterized protein n=1 Tax=Lojkania enalia TaxID=147567 RepID=A0A9P4K1N7_9PLEO|nr:hypothetical protein CC78DRAFT_584974 [Didymosphaeria enalia]
MATSSLSSSRIGASSISPMRGSSTTTTSTENSKTDLPSLVVTTKELLSGAKAGIGVGAVVGVIGPLAPLATILTVPSQRKLSTPDNMTTYQQTATSEGNGPAKKFFEQNASFSICQLFELYGNCRIGLPVNNHSLIEIAPTSLIRETPPNNVIE